MPTNLLRKANTPRPEGKQPTRRKPGTAREIIIRAGTVVVRARLLETPTSDRIWATLPLYSTAETWGGLVHFETHAETGREPGAVRRVKPGQIAYWAEEDRVVIGFAETPLSKAGEIYLPAPSNIWAVALDDVSVLARVVPGERVAVLQADS